MGNDGDLFREWRAADRAAHALEQQVVKSSMRALNGLEPVPLQSAHDEAHRLRATATDLFKLAMDEMAVRARNVRR